MVIQYLASMLAVSHVGRDAGVLQVAEKALGHFREVRLVADAVAVGHADAEPRPLVDDGEAGAGLRERGHPRSSAALHRRRVGGRLGTT